jgi:hypothetical protein
MIVTELYNLTLENVFHYLRTLTSNIIKGKIQHDKTFAAAAAIATTINLKKIKFNTCKVAKLKRDYRVAKN